MIFTSYGAVREVTGSLHLITSETDKILLDCGLFQGKRNESAEKNRIFPIDPTMITNMVLSHAHIDHCGRVPLLTKSNFAGRIMCTRATKHAAEYLLQDSAHIQESDARYLNYKSVRSFLVNVKKSSQKNEITHSEINDIKKLLKSGPHKIKADVIQNFMDKYRLQAITPLYNKKDAERSLERFDGVPYKHSVKIGKNTSCTFYDAGHILGSSMCLLKITEKGRTYKILFTGDLGRFDKPIINDPDIAIPEEDRNLDLLVLESTYGNREHDPVKNLKHDLKNVILETIAANGSLIIPSFAFGRTQEIIYLLHELYNEDAVPHLPVYIDSPLANNLTRVFAEHPEVYDEATHKTFLQNGENPFTFENITYTSSVEESMQVTAEKKPHIVIASSGMCEAGRILHHMRFKIHNPNNTLLFVGYQAQHTLGRKILNLAAKHETSSEAAPEVRILNKVYPLKCRVKELGGFSAHADYKEILKFMKLAKLQPKKIAVIHGEEEQSLAFAKLLEQEGHQAVVPYAGEPVHI